MVLQLTPLPTRTRTGKVAVGTDGSYWGHAALMWAARWACTAGAELDIYEVDRRLEPIPPDVPSDIGTSAVLHEFPLLPMRVHSSGSTPSGALLAASKASDLVVLGYRGHRRGSLGLGHNALRVAALAACGVVVVRGRPTAVRGEHRCVTVSVSGTESDEPPLLWASKIAVVCRSTLHVLHVSPVETVDGTNPAAVVNRIAARLAAVRPRPRTRIEMVHGHPHEVVSALSSTDLFVVGRKRSERKPIGLVAKSALHQAQCPVLVVGG